MKKPTLADVARLSGVAPVTVSRAINTPEMVNKDTLARVNGAIAALKYEVNVAARALAGRGWGSVGVVVPSLDHVMFPRQLRVFESMMSAHGISLLISATNYDGAKEGQIVRKLVARGVDGVLLSHIERPQEIFHYLSQHAIPSVLMGSRSLAQAANWIAYDDFGAMQKLVDHLHGLGHLRIGMIADSRAQINAEGRLRAVHDRLAELDLAMPESWLRRCESDAAGEAFESLMAEPNGPTAIICGNDRSALGAMARAKQRGIGVPDSVSITGFDDMEFTEHPLISLTTVRTPWRKLGEAAADAMLRAFAQQDPLEVLLPAEIVVRGSTAPPRRAGGAH